MECISDPADQFEKSMEQLSCLYRRPPPDNTAEQKMLENQIEREGTILWRCVAMHVFRMGVNIDPSSVCAFLIERAKAGGATTAENLVELLAVFSSGRKREPICPPIPIGIRTPVDSKTPEDSKSPEE